MEAKLTLKLNKKVINQAKSYAKDRNTSLSKLIENYLQTVTLKKKEKSVITPLVESLTGVIDMKDKDYRKDYTDFISKKYS
jgi:hypothetical protein